VASEFLTGLIVSQNGNIAHACPPWSKSNYSYSVVYLRFAGSHQEYDQIDVEEI
jgi:hypothetical protein